MVDLTTSESSSIGACAELRSVLSESELLCERLLVAHCSWLASHCIHVRSHAEETNIVARKRNLPPEVVGGIVAGAGVDRSRPLLRVRR